MIIPTGAIVLGFISRYFFVEKYNLLKWSENEVLITDIFYEE